MRSGLCLEFISKISSIWVIFSHFWLKTAHCKSQFLAKLLKFVWSEGCPNAEATRQRLRQYLDTEFPLELNRARLSCSVHIANLGEIYKTSCVCWKNLGLKWLPYWPSHNRQWKIAYSICGPVIYSNTLMELVSSSMIVILQLPLQIMINCLPSLQSNHLHRLVLVVYPKWCPILYWNVNLQ